MNYLDTNGMIKGWLVLGIRSVYKNKTDVKKLKLVYPGSMGDIMNILISLTQMKTVNIENEIVVQTIMEGVKSEKHLKNSRSQACANFRVNECLIDLLI
ncbi:MAG: hypothetical protein Pg6B_09810 [Candidatus Azobacteroides pseudotrichonymphae]|jgi:hypothetical protein|nr:MAG: hypothetical protein Pg6B_09810 [Candidatus Azobacteroides pseudotrichonymphae]